MKPVIAAVIATASLAAAMPAAAATVSTAGDTTGSPTFNRPVTGFSARSGVGTSVRYDSYAFTVDAAGSYTFAATSTFDNMLFLYTGAFDPTAPLTNGLASDDDSGVDNNALLSQALAANTLYTLVFTGFENDDFGIYGLGATGPGNFALANAVPEPATWALMILGFGAVGGAMRRRQAVKATVRFA